MILLILSCVESGGNFLGNDITCVPNPCSNTGACCFPEGFGRLCSVEGDEECNGIDGAVYQDDGTVCAEVECPTADQ